MELAKESLEDKLKRGEKLDKVEFEKILDQIGSCMQTISQKFCHRDIKPANILCFDNGNYKLTDLGVSVTLHNGTSTARVVRGTEIYLSDAFKQMFKGPGNTNSNVLGENFKEDDLQMEDSFNFGMTLL